MVTQMGRCLSLLCVCLSIVSSISGCGDKASEEDIQAHRQGDSDEQELARAEVQARKTIVWYQGTNPPRGQLTVELGSKVFKVPTEYVGQNPLDSLFFDFGISWPNACPLKAPCEGDEKSGDNIVHVLVQPNTHAADSYSALQTNIKDSSLTGPLRAADYEGLEVYSNPENVGGWDHYVSTDLHMKTPLGNPPTFQCNKERVWHDKPLRRCQEYFKYAEGIQVEVRFYSDNLTDWKKINKTVIGLLDKFTGEEE